MTRLVGTVEHPFGVDFIEWPSPLGMLLYLEENAGIRVIGKVSGPLSNGFHAQFEFGGHLFELTTLISTPCLLARQGCDEQLFNKLLEKISHYSGTSLTKLFVGRMRHLLVGLS